MRSGTDATDAGIIETIGYFTLNSMMQAGHAPPTAVPMGWMVSRTLLAVMLLAAVAVERYLPTARQPSRETALAVLVNALRWLREDIWRAGRGKRWGALRLLPEDAVRAYLAKDGAVAAAQVQAGLPFAEKAVRRAAGEQTEIRNLLVDWQERQGHLCATALRGARF